EGILPTNDLNVVMVDTFTVNLSTVAVLDSFATSSDTSFYIGSWTDANTGTQSYIGYTTPSFPSNTLYARTGITYDSLVMVLPYSYTYGDTTQNFTLKMFPMTETLIETQTYYNIYSAAYSSTALIEKTFLPRKHDVGTLRLRLGDVLGQKLFTALKDRTITDDLTLHEVIPGIAYTGTPTGNTILGFSINSDRAMLRIYYHENDDIPTAETVDITFSGKHFTQVSNDFTGTPLANLVNRGDQVSSTLTDNMSYMVQGNALRTRVTFPYLSQLDYADATWGVNRAELVFQPVRLNLQDNMDPPSAMALYTTNSLNEQVNPVEASFGTGTAMSASYAYSLVTNELVDSYTFKLTYYFNALLKKEKENLPLILSLTAPGTYLNFSRTALGDKYHTKDYVKLRLYLTPRN
ncbi:MAG: hypothetical protein QM669_10655, partial [Siphonobacter sp.]